jgi:hypothetical protein
MKAIIALTALLTASIATAERVTVDGKDYDISFVKGTYDEHKELLASQPWFGHKSLALEFMAETYGMKFDGTRRDAIIDATQNHGGNKSAYFAYLDEVMPDGRTVQAGYAGMVSDSGGCSVGGPDDNSQGWPCSYWPVPGAGPTGAGPGGYDTMCYEYDSSYTTACHFAVATPAAATPEPFSVLPQSGNYAASGSFDIVVTGITASIDHITSIYDGNNINDVLAGCWVQKTDTSISCNGIGWGGLGLGQHTFEVYLDLSNGEQHYESVTWTVY